MCVKNHFSQPSMDVNGSGCPISPVHKVRCRDCPTAKSILHIRKCDHLATQLLQPFIQAKNTVNAWRSSGHTKTYPSLTSNKIMQLLRIKICVSAFFWSQGHISSVHLIIDLKYVPQAHFRVLTANSDRLKDLNDVGITPLRSQPEEFIGRGH